MVSNESQRTHMSFDGLSDVLGALSAEDVAREIEGRQRPHGGDGVANSDNPCHVAVAAPFAVVFAAPIA